MQKAKYAFEDVFENNNVCDDLMVGSPSQYAKFGFDEWRCDKYCENLPNEMAAVQYCCFYKKHGNCFIALCKEKGVAY